MALDPSIILGGQPVNALAAMQSGNQLAGQTMDMQRQNALAQLYQSQGAGIMNGDPNALNALAGYDPQAAMGFKSAQQDMSFSAEKMQMVRDQAKQSAAEHAAKMSAGERAAQAAQIKRGVSAAIAAKTPQEWDQIVTQFGAADLVGQFDKRQAIIYSYMGVADALKAANPAAPEWRNATPEEAKAHGAVAGQINTKTGKFDAQNPPSGMKIESDGKGGFTMVQGAGVTSGSEAGGMQPSSPEAMLATIDGILADPALEYSTGVMSPLQMVPGTPQKRFQGRANQLNGQAFLQAFQSLKGGGQITEIEGAKATQAIGRLDTAQSPEDYRSALTGLKQILTDAQTRPIGWAYNQPNPTLKQGNTPETGAIEGGYRFKGGNPADPNAWEQVN